MSAACHPHPAPSSADPRFRRALWIALVVNLGMGVFEVLAAGRSGSVSLLADSIDFFGDSANYALSLAVLGTAIATRARASLLKGACMGGFGLFVLGSAVWKLWSGTPPQALTMGAVAFIALLANTGVAWLLYRFRGGDSNMRSVWICSRNDAIGNAAVLLAAVGVAGTAQAWPDLLVAAIMSGLALTGSISVLRHARAELKAGHALPHAGSHAGHGH